MVLANFEGFEGFRRHAAALAKSAQIKLAQAVVSAEAAAGAAHAKLAAAVAEASLDRKVLAQLLGGTDGAASPAADDNSEAADSLPMDCWALILARVDPDTLATAVPRVCTQWRALAELVWRHRLGDGLTEQLGSLAQLGPNVSAGHLHLAMCGRNFLRNPAFRGGANSQLLELGRAVLHKHQRTAWVASLTSANRVAFEPEALGLHEADDASSTSTAAPPPPLPYAGGGVRLRNVLQHQLQGFLGGLQQHTQQPPRQEQGEGASRPEAPPTPCLATSSDWCEVVQVVDMEWELTRRGLSAVQAAHLLDAGLRLRLSVYVGCRHDSLGKYSLGLMLDEGPQGGGGAVPAIHSFVEKPGRHRYFSGRVRCPAAGGWARVEYEVPACPRGFRRALVLLRGCRAGDDAPPDVPTMCGAKFACAELVFS